MICSFLRVSKHLPVSPTYHKTQSTQSILYSIHPSKAVDLIFFFKLFSKRTLHPSHPLCASINSFVITYIITNVLSHLLKKYFAKINNVRHFCQLLVVCRQTNTKTQASRDVSTAYRYKISHDSDYLIRKCEENRDNEKRFVCFRCYNITDKL